MDFIVSIGVNFGQVFTGGVVALHKLAYEIANRGYKVTIFTWPEYPHENIISRPDCSEDNLNFEYDINSTVIVPSFGWKNTSGIKNVVRWALSDIDENLYSNVEENDIIYTTSDWSIPTTKQKNLLTVVDYHKEIFYNFNKERTKKFCYITNKYHPDNWWEIFETYYKADSLNNWKEFGYGYLAEKFNEYEYFLTYDHKSFYTMAAAMCGTKAVVLDERIKNPFEHKLNTPTNLFGVSYGWKDLKWADETIPLVPLLIETLEKNDSDTVDNFINYWKQRVQNH